MRPVIVHALFAAVLSGLAAVAGGCDRAPPAPCPAGFARNETRQGHLLDKLRASSEGRATLARWREPLQVCFGEARTSSVTEAGVLLMDGRLDEARGAARAAHLVAHLADGLPALARGKGDCEARVSRLLAAEARALALELRVARDLSAPPAEGGPFEVETVFWQAAPEAREAALVSYLRAHPDGAPGVDGLAAGYARRCAAE
jgi:hypothetical protein